MNQKTEQQSQQNSPPQMPPIGGYPAAYGYYPQEDEINLIDLWKVLAKKKMTILGTTVLHNRRSYFCIDSAARLSS